MQGAEISDLIFPMLWEYTNLATVYTNLKAQLYGERVLYSYGLKTEGTPSQCCWLTVNVYCKVAIDGATAVY